jgi:AcrR family transcriptional regulator
MREATDRGAPPIQRLRAGTLEFLRFVEERRDGWRVLYSEAAARGGPVAEQVASLRAAIAQMIKRLLIESAAGVEATDVTTAALDGVAHAFVGAGESLANWWLEHPELPAERAVDLLIAVGRAGVEEATRTAAQPGS